MRETKIFYILPLIHPPNETDPLIVFILYFNSITIVETRKFKIGTVTTKVDTKRGSNEHRHHQIHGLSRGRPLIIDRIWVILLA